MPLLTILVELYCICLVILKLMLPITEPILFSWLVDSVYLSRIKMKRMLVEMFGGGGGGF